MMETRTTVGRRWPLVKDERIVLGAAFDRLLERPDPLPQLQDLPFEFGKADLRSHLFERHIQASLRKKPPPPRAKLHRTSLRGRGPEHRRPSRYHPTCPEDLCSG